MHPGFWPGMTLPFPPLTQKPSPQQGTTHGQARKLVAEALERLLAEQTVLLWCQAEGMTKAQDATRSWGEPTTVPFYLLPPKYWYGGMSCCTFTFNWLWWALVLPRAPSCLGIYTHIHRYLIFTYAFKTLTWWTSTYSMGCTGKPSTLQGHRAATLAQQLNALLWNAWLYTKSLGKFKSWYKSRFGWL